MSSTLTLTLTLALTLTRYELKLDAAGGVPAKLVRGLRATHIRALPEAKRPVSAAVAAAAGSAKRARAS